MEAIIILLLIAFDQWTKGLAERLIGRTGHVTVIPNFFELRLTYNKGAAWSFLSDKSWGLVFLCIISLLITVALLYVLKHTTGKRLRFVLILIISGSAGNLIDRLRVGAVADFFSFTFGDYVFPTFNVADSFITVGTALLIIFIIFDRTFLDGLLSLRPARRSHMGDEDVSDEFSEECEHESSQLNAQNVPETRSQDRSGDGR